MGDGDQSNYCSGVPNKGGQDSERRHSSRPHNRLKGPPESAYPAVKFDMSSYARIAQNSFRGSAGHINGFAAPFYPPIPRQHAIDAW